MNEITLDQRIKGDKLIVIFHRGGKLIKPHLPNSPYWSIEYPRLDGGWYGGSDIINNLKYSSSWDALMPVCKKLDMLTEDKIIPHTKPYELLCDEMDNAITRYEDILDVWLIVVKFIRWYNKNYPA